MMIKPVVMMMIITIIVMTVTTITEITKIIITKRINNRFRIGFSDSYQGANACFVIL